MANTYSIGTKGAPLVAETLDGLTNVICSVIWTYDGVDPTGKFAGHFEGPVSFAAPNPESYTPFDQVTPTMLNGWVNDTVSVAPTGAAGTDKDGNAIPSTLVYAQAIVDAQIAAKIAAAANTSTPVPMPLVATG